MTFEEWQACRLLKRFLRCPHDKQRCLPRPTIKKKKNTECWKCYWKDVPDAKPQA